MVYTTVRNNLYCKIAINFLLGQYSHVSVSNKTSFQPWLVTNLPAETQREAINRSVTMLSRHR